MGNRLSHPDGSSSGQADNVCPALPTPLDDADKAIGPFTVHQFLQILAGASGIVAILISMLLFFQHAFNVRNPAEQIKIMRIITIIPVFAVLSFVCLCLGQASIYLDPWIEVWEAICICSFLLLILTYVDPDPDAQMRYFDTLPLKNLKGQASGDSSAGFYKRVRVLVFQMLPVLTALSILTDITQAAGVYCINSNKPHFAHIWNTVLHGICTGVAVFAVIRMCGRLRPELPGRAVWTQLFAFKTIIGLNVTQTFGFSIAAGQITPTNTLSYNDISVGLPQALIIVEMVLFAVAFHKFYSVGPYKAGGAFALSGTPVMRPWVAVAKALNPLEVFEGAIAAFTGKAGGKRAYMAPSYAMGALPAGKRPSQEGMVSRPAETHAYGPPSHASDEDTAYHSGPATPYDGQAYGYGGHQESGRVDVYDPPPRY